MVDKIEILDINILNMILQQSPGINEENEKNIDQIISINFSYEAPILFATVNVTFVHFDENKENHRTLGIFQIMVVFLIKEVISENQNLNDVYESLVGLAYSTSRGVIYSKTAGHPANGSILKPYTNKQLMRFVQNL